MPLRRPDPRLDPMLHPHRWRRRLKWRSRLGRFVAGLLGVALALSVYLWWQYRDRTAGMSPAAVAKAAGEAILASEGYRFQVRLSGDSRDKHFPSAVMNGHYQNAPLLLHLSGEAVTGGTSIGLEYYLADQDLYVRSPSDHSWMLVRNADLEELYSFQPNHLALPLTEGVLQAEVLGRERLPGGDTLRLKLDLDPAVMQRRLGGTNSAQVDYTLWVYTRSLKPARFAIDYRGSPQLTSSTGVTSFSYVLDWDFSRAVGQVSLPDEVRQSAREIQPQTARPAKP